MSAPDWIRIGLASMLQPDEPLPVNELGGAYFRDPEGNKICVACHTPEPDPA